MIGKLKGVATLLLLFISITFSNITFAENTLTESDSVKTEESRPVTGTYSLTIGRMKTLSTYLSPQHFYGTIYGVSGHWSKAMPFNPQITIMDFDTYVSMGTLFNKASTASMVTLIADFSWGMSWRTNPLKNLQVSAGGIIDLETGALYLTRNSNNPVTALASLRLGISGSVSYHFNIGKLPILLQDRLSLPLGSIFFSPQYGETYYEISLGNYSGIIHAGWWGSDFKIDNKLAAILDFGRTALEIGYRFYFTNQHACSLTTRRVTNLFTIGVIPGGIGLKKKNATVNYSLY